MVNINTDRTKEIFLSILKNNEKLIVGTVCTVIAGAICAKFDIPVKFDGTNAANRYSDYDGAINSDYVSFPRNSKEAAITSLVNAARISDFDSNRTDIAKKIATIIAGDVDDATRSYGIDALSRISKDMDFDSGKRAIANLIFDITKG